MARRAKINRQVDTSVIRLNVYRRDDNGDKFKTSVSLDPHLFDLASALFGGPQGARDMLEFQARLLWNEDFTRRKTASESQTPCQGTASISRLLQRKVLEAAISKIQRNGSKASDDISV